MSLLREAEAVAEKKRVADDAYRKKLRDDAIKKVRDGFKYAFKENPASVEWTGSLFGAVATSEDGLKFTVNYGRSSSTESLHLIRECPDCGVEYIGASVYATKNNYGPAHEKKPGLRRKEAITALAAALNSDRAVGDTKHTCYESEVRQIRAAVTLAAKRLRTSEADLLFRAGLLG